MADEPLIKRFLKLQNRFPGYLVAITRDLDAAEEILQDVAVVVKERPPAEPLVDFVAWCKEVVRRQALHYLREKGRSASKVRPVDPVLLEGISQAFLDDATDPERLSGERQLLIDCLRRLPPNSAELIALRYEQRRSFDE